MPGTEQIASLTDRGIRTLVSPDAGKRKTPGLTRQRRKHYLEMREQLATDEGKALYRQRQAIIEPVFAQTKHNRRIDRFQRRGLWACRAEWRLITATPQPPQALAARPNDRHWIAGGDPSSTADPVQPIANPLPRSAARLRNSLAGQRASRSSACRGRCLSCAQYPIFLACRLRNAWASDGRGRHRLSKFLLRRGHRYEEGGHGAPSTCAGCVHSGSRTPVLGPALPDYLAAVELVAGVPIKLTYLHIIAGSGTWLVMTAPPAGIKILTTFSNGATIWCLALVADV